MEGREPGITPVKIAGASEHDPHKLGARAEPDGGHKGPAPKRIVTGYGFWIFLLSDFIMFSGFYAAYAVLSHATAGGPGPQQALRSEDRRARDRVPAAVELRLRHGDDRQQRAQHAVDAGRLLITGLLGLGFLALEVNEFAKMLARGRRARTAARSCRRSSRSSAATACT